MQHPCVVDDQVSCLDRQINCIGMIHEGWVRFVLRLYMPFVGVG
jgi:hypothetical protein